MTNLTQLPPPVSLAVSCLAAALLLLAGCRSTAAVRTSNDAAARPYANAAAGVNSNNSSLNARATGAATGQTVNSATNTNLY